MKFLGDVPIARSTLAWLRERGHDAVHVRDVLSTTADDAEIVRFVAREHVVILCFDLDFSQIVATSAESIPSVITFRTTFRSARYIEDRLHDVLDDLMLHLANGCLAVVEDRRVRVRHLPIRD